MPRLLYYVGGCGGSLTEVCAWCSHHGALLEHGADAAGEGSRGAYLLTHGPAS